MEIGWIGTGIMGAPMARRLIGGGNRVRVFNRSAEKARALAADGATVAADAAACAAGAEMVFIMVPDTPDVEATVAKIEPVLKPGQIVIDMSTVAPVGGARDFGAAQGEGRRVPGCSRVGRRRRRSRRHARDNGREAMRRRSSGRGRCSS